MTPEEVLRKAAAAERLFKDPLMQEALDSMEKEVMEAWMACPVRDVEGRETLWRIAVTTRKFRDLLRGTMEAGKLAKAQLAEVMPKPSVADKVANVFSNRNWR